MFKIYLLNVLLKWKIFLQQNRIFNFETHVNFLYDKYLMNQITPLNTKINYRIYLIRLTVIYNIYLTSITEIIL